MAKMIDEKPFFKGEGKVWDKLSEYLPSNMVVYNQREINGREYDFCVMAENLGIVVIEVKGWLAEKIIVNGVDNIDVEGYERPQTSPKKQARVYRFAILNKISEKYNVSPLVLDMVCYPFISKAEYESSRLDIVSEEQYTIFKEDLEDRERLNNKIINIFQVNSVIPHSDFSYDLMFRIRRSLEPNIKENIEGGKVLPYSKLYIIPDMPNITEVEEMIDTYFMGVKSIIFVGDSACYKNIIRCLQESPCRYMLADEVGMGKTIEAISVYKIYTMNQSNKKALIVVPQVLKEQWISELLLKFNIPNGMGKNNNSVTVKTLQELSEKDLFTDWDFVIVDEVHKYLFSQSEYEKLHKISTLAKNILLLSATPVQQKKEEYLDLLRLLLPQKYNSFSVEKFGKLIAKQSKIIQKTALILDDLGDFEEEINSLAESAHDSEECEELFEEIHEDLEEICDELDDDKLNELLQQIKYENDDLGVYTIKVIISYICSNYQIESNIIRNRRKILESTDEDVQLMASRDLVELTYLTDNEVNPYEQLSYNGFANWIIKGLESGILDVELDIKPLLSRFFSSPWAFYKQAKLSKMDESILDNIRKWLESEQFNVDHINDILDDPDKFADSYASRLVIVINALYDDFCIKKIVLWLFKLS